MDTEYLKRVGLYILGALLSIGLVFYLGYHIWRTFTLEVETTPALQTTVQATDEASGYIFRYEVPVSGTVGGGSAVASVRVGESVKAGGEVARIYSVASPDIEAKIDETDAQIELLRECSASSGGVTLKDSATVDREIYSLLGEMRRLGDSGDAAGAVSLRSQFLSLVNKRSLLTSSSSGNFDSEIAALEAKRSELTSKLGTCLQTVTSSAGGYFYPSCDGYETVFDPTVLDSATYASLSLLLSSQPASNGANCIGKTVTRPEWYLAVRLDRSYAANFKEGGSCTVVLKSCGETVDMDVYSVTSGADEVILVLTTRYMPENFDFARSQDIEIVKAEYTGLSVPQSALRVADGKTGVYILDGSKVRFCTVDVIYKSDGVCIISEEGDDTEDTDGEDTTDASDTTDANNNNTERRLRLHDSIITKGKGLYDGRIIGG